MSDSNSAKLPFWRRTRQRLASDFEQRRYLMDTALRYIESTCERLDGANHGVWLAAASRLIRLYDSHISNQYALALDVISQYGSLLDRHATGNLGCPNCTPRSC